MRFIQRFLIFTLFRIRWIVGYDDDLSSKKEGQLGIRILGINLYYYKWPEPMISKMRWRFAEKREFGESIRIGRNKKGE